ncbi:MAG: sigma factor G inhibitor Gin [Desulfitobacteriia bacterium]
MEKVFPKCQLCGLVPPKGLYDGFRIGKKLICSNCEKKLTGSDVLETEYLSYIGKIKRLLYS